MSETACIFREIKLSPISISEDSAKEASAVKASGMTFFPIHRTEIDIRDIFKNKASPLYSLSD